MTTISSAHQITAAERYASALTDDLACSLRNGQSVTITNTAAGSQLTSKLTIRQQPADSVSFSPQALSIVQSEQTALTVLNTIKHTTVTATSKVNATIATASPMTMIAQTIATATAKTDPMTSSASSASASSAFETQFAAEAAAGPEGRYYNSTTPQDLAPMMSDEEYASFKEAFDNRTLTIQTAASAPGVQFTGSVTTTFSEGSIGGSESMSGQGPGVDTSQLLKTSKYALVVYDPFFGPSVISWGGPPDKAPSTPSTV